MYPNFLVIGAQKAGTTWLYRNLRVHPQVWMPKEKELHYFDEKIRLEGGIWSRLRGDRAADVRWRRQLRSRFKRFPNESSVKDLGWHLRYFFKTPNDAWYASLFEQGNGKITGETTPDYSILDLDTIAHVHELMPDAKIVFMMRSPIERPWSVVDMSLRVGGRSLEEISDEDLCRESDNKRTRLMTDYLRTLENWGSFYPQEQIFVGFLEDVHFYPNRLLHRLYSFLGASTNVEYKVIRRRIHSGFQETMPLRLATHQARTYRDDLERLEDRFGGYASFWRYCAQRLIEDPPQGDKKIAYPLWESLLWEEWVSSRPEGEAAPGTPEAEPQSGPLSSVQRSLSGE